MKNRTGSAEIEVMRLSTTGMIEYRLGRIDVGRALYLQAIEKAASSGIDRLRARAFVFMAMEERRSNTAEFAKARELAEKFSKNLHDSDLHGLVERLKKFDSAR